MAGDDEFGGLWDDAKEALHWRPILPLLASLRTASTSVERLKAARNVAAFAIRAAGLGDPYKSQAFLDFCVLVDVAERDQAFRKVVEARILPRS